MENLTDSFKDLQLKKALFDESVDPDEEETLDIGSWNVDLAVRKSLSCGAICDEDFYPPGVGMEMILRDQDAKDGNGLENVTSCSSWAINSQHCHSEGLGQTAIAQQCEELFVNFNDCTEFHGFSASTPKTKQPSLFPTTLALSKTKDTILKPSVEDHDQVSFNRRDSSLWPMLLHGETAANAWNVPTIFGTRKKQNTQTLEARQIAKDPFQAYGGSEGNSNFQSFDFQNYDDTTVRTSSDQNNARSLYEMRELWIIKPQTLTLDASGKGRLLLINKSSNRNLKFKIVFDGKLINVCPQSGNLRSKSEIGLRVIVSRSLKENSKEVIEDVIRITCGNIEKKVPVTIHKVQKEKSMKDRSFRCF